MFTSISLRHLSLAFSNKICFENFSAEIYPGNRIAIIGRNGSGKSSLLNILCKKLTPSDGEVIFSTRLNIGHVEQVIENFNDLSGGQRLNKRISQALAQLPDLLLLDEPTNHLDKENRISLLRMLKRYRGTLIVVSHDTELLRHYVDCLWHIDNQQIKQFFGSYDHYIQEIRQKHIGIEKELSLLKRDKQNAHENLMQEQRRAAKSKAKGQKSIDTKKWPTVVSKAKATRAEQTHGRNKSSINKKRQTLMERLSDLNLPEIIVPKFSLSSENFASGNVLSIYGANIGYNKDKMILKDVVLSINAKERVAITGRNASGKSTLLKAILGDEEIIINGSCHLPRNEHIGYLDQHYSNLKPELSVFSHIKELCQDWSDSQIRSHLSDFLFRKTEDVNQLASNLSGGEKARLSLSIIAIQTPRLLILDEVTNNLDLETKEHVMQILQNYPGAMIIVSHEEHFIEAINPCHIYTLVDGRLIT